VESNPRISCILLNIPQTTGVAGREGVRTGDVAASSGRVQGAAK